MLKSVALLFSGLFAVLPAKAQQYVPTDVDLRAAYCMSATPSWLPKTDKIIERYKRYVAPKMILASESMGATAAFVAATSQGEDDAIEATTKAKVCMSILHGGDKSGFLDCWLPPNSELRERVTKCLDASWLPY